MNGLSKTSFRATPFFYWTFLSAFFALAFAGPSVSAQSTSLTEEMKKEFGSANWIPADASYYTASYRINEQWEAFVNSEAFRQLKILPGVQLGLMQLRQHPSYIQFQETLASNQDLQEAVALGQDMFSQEAFLYVDQQGNSCLSALQSIYYEIYFKSMISGIFASGQSSEREKEKELLNSTLGTLVSYKESLKLPGFILGFKLESPERAQSLLDKFIPLLQGAIPYAIEEENIGDNRYYSLHLESKMFLTTDQTSEAFEELRSKGVSEETLSDLKEMLHTFTLSVSIGLRDQYLLISLGADNSHLSGLGTGVSLAASEQLKPIRKHFKNRLCGLSYIHPALTGTGKLDVDSIVDYLLNLVLETEYAIPEGLIPRAEKDLRQLLGEINQYQPNPTASLKSSFLNRGYESFTFSANYPGRYDTSEPLGIFEFAGPKPLFVYASHTPSSQKSYESIAHWLQVLYGYFEDYAVPQIPEKDLDDFKKFEFVVLPFVKELHVTTKDLLIPAIDGCPSLFAIDGGGKVTVFPNKPEPLKRPIRFPRLTLACELNDSDKFIEAFASYRESLNGLISDISIMEDTDPQNVFQIPAPGRRVLAAGWCYSYELPVSFDLGILDSDFEPHAYIQEDRLILSLSPLSTIDMLDDDQVASSEVVDMSAPAGSLTWFDIQGLIQLLVDDVDIVVEELAMQDKIDAMAAGMIRYHAIQIGKSLRAMRSYQSRTFVEEEYQVTHSWFHIEDISE